MENAIYFANQIAYWNQCIQYWSDEILRATGADQVNALIRCREHAEKHKAEAKAMLARHSNPA